MTWEVGDLVYYEVDTEERTGFIVGQLNEEQITLAVSLAYVESYLKLGTYLVQDFESGLRGMARGDILKELK